MASPSEVTQLIAEYSRGDQAALDRLLPLVYAELHRMARRYMGRENPANSLQPTALIHEAYFRLTGLPANKWENRAHFFGVAAQSMRHVLVDHARARYRNRRGGEKHLLPLDEGLVVSGKRVAGIVALDDALTDLAKLHPRQSKVVELKYFGGLTVEETAEALQVCPETVMRDWRIAKAWLYRHLGGSETKRD
jgi:RNA polymerase sigma-70 factor (ECF subfamily)